MFEVPNLDDFSTDPIDFIEAAKVLRELAVYCETKGFAIIERSKNCIESAMILECRNEITYKYLPAWAKW